MVTCQYPLKYGAQNMRSVVVNPPHPFTEKLQAAGYHVMWPGKTDFQGVPEKNLAQDRKSWINAANRVRKTTLPGVTATSRPGR